MQQSTTIVTVLEFAEGQTARRIIIISEKQQNGNAHIHICTVVYIHVTEGSRRVHEHVYMITQITDTCATESSGRVHEYTNY